METTTKITTATVRIALSFNYNTFEVSAQMENENGISVADINNTRADCQELASTAVAQYKIANSSNPKEEIKKVENMIGKLKKEFAISETKEEKQPTPEEIKEVESLPMYTDVKSVKAKKK